MLPTAKRTTFPLLYYFCASSIAPRTFSFSRNNNNFNRNKNIIIHNMSTNSANDILSKTQVSIADAISVHGQGNVKFLYGAKFMDKSIDCRKIFETGPRIQNARYYDYDDIKTSTPDNLPHMMPEASLHSAAMDAMDIKDTDHVILYGPDNCFFVCSILIQHRCTLQTVAIIVYTESITRRVFGSGKHVQSLSCLLFLVVTSSVCIQIIPFPRGQLFHGSSALWQMLVSWQNWRRLMQESV